MDMTVSCLIPAWNEGARIATVLRVVRDHPGLTEVIVIDDGSSDGTARIAGAEGARVLVLPENRGKSAAVAAGLAEARGDFILLLDADLTGLTAAHVTALLAPVLSGRAEVSLSLRQNAPWLWRRIGLDYISGERVMARRLIQPHLPRIAGLRRFGLEVFLNQCWLAAGLRVAVVRLDGVASPAKARKRGLWRGLHADLKMMADIFRTVRPWVALDQILRLRQASRHVMELSSNRRTGVTEGP